MPNTANISIGATLITFFNLKYWGLDPELDYEQWTDAVYKDPKRYFDGMLDGMREAGVEGVEFAPIPGGWEGALKAYGSAAATADALDLRNLRAGSSYQNGAELIGNALVDESAESTADEYTDRHARFVSELGGKFVVMGTVPRAQFTGGDFTGDIPRSALEAVARQIDRLAAVAGKHGVQIALHTDAYSVCSRAQDVASILELTDPANVQLCLDAGHTALDGGDPVQVLCENLGRIPLMHWKDCIQALDGSTLTGPQHERHAEMMRYFRIFGQGAIDWRAWQRVLSDGSWRGWAMAENDMAPDPVGEIRAGIDFFSAELAEIYR